jgi:hypothetical protein
LIKEHQTTTAHGRGIRVGAAIIDAVAGANNEVSRHPSEFSQATCLHFRTVKTPAMVVIPTIRTDSRNEKRRKI